ncbi:MAG TPA: hypothetical protein VIY48_04635 [Candidatus Paceibacterota bacterium]
MALPVSPFAGMSHRGRGETKSIWLEQDQLAHLPPILKQHFNDSCARIDARNKGLAEIASILRETREGLAADNSSRGEQA